MYVKTIAVNNLQNTTLLFSSIIPGFVYVLKPTMFTWKNNSVSTEPQPDRHTQKAAPGISWCLHKSQEQHCSVTSAMLNFNSLSVMLLDLHFL